jgi:ATP-binding cassette subfamily B protein
MSELDAAANGRPTTGVLLTQELAQSAQRRARGRDLRPLGAIWPYLRAHIVDAILATLFLLTSASATIGLSAAVRVVVDRGVKLHTYQSLNHTFLLLTAVVAVLAIATAARFYYITRLAQGAL